MIYVLTVFVGILIIEVAVIGEFVADLKRTFDEILDVLDVMEADSKREVKRK